MQGAEQGQWFLEKEQPSNAKCTKFTSIYIKRIKLIQFRSYKFTLDTGIEKWLTILAHSQLRAKSRTESESNQFSAFHSPKLIHCMQQSINEPIYFHPVSKALKTEISLTMDKYLFSRILSRYPDRIEKQTYKGISSKSIS